MVELPKQDITSILGLEIDITDPRLRKEITVAKLGVEDKTDIYAVYEQGEFKSVEPLIDWNLGPVHRLAIAVCTADQMNAEYYLNELKNHMDDNGRFQDADPVLTRVELDSIHHAGHATLKECNLYATSVKTVSDYDSVEVCLSSIETMKEITINGQDFTRLHLKEGLGDVHIYGCKEDVLQKISDLIENDDAIDLDLTIDLDKILLQSAKDHHEQSVAEIEAYASANPPPDNQETVKSLMEQAKTKFDLNLDSVPPRSAEEAPHKKQNPKATK